MLIPNKKHVSQNLWFVVGSYLTSIYTLIAVVTNEPCPFARANGRAKGRGSLADIIIHP